MNRLITLLAAVLIVGTPLAQGEGSRDETKLTLRHQVLKQINRDRVARGLAPVQLDATVSALADAYCAAQIRNQTTGHFTTDGKPPYLRFSEGGVDDGVSENAAAWSGSYTFSDRAVYDMARRSHEAMMAERAPHDGHKRTILDPHATHVGIGLAWERGELRLAQEFVRRYIEWSRPMTREASLHEIASGSGKPRPGFKVEAISVHYEPFPVAMPAHVANAMDNYRLPDDRRDYLPRLRSYINPRADGTFELVKEEYDNGRRGDFRVAADGTFTFDVPFREGAGLYTVVVWVRAKDSRGEAIAASNVSIRVRGTALAGTQ